MTDSCARLVQLKENAAATNTKLTEQMNAEIDPIRKEISQISAAIAAIPAVNMSKSAYPTFYTLKDGASGDARAQQFRQYCSSTGSGGYPAGAFEWTGTQEEDGTGRILNWCGLGGPNTGSCQTKGWCAISSDYLNSLKNTADGKVASYNAQLSAKAANMQNIINSYKARMVADVSMPACCQVLSAAGANLNVPVINQTCQTSALAGSTGGSTSDGGSVAAALTPGVANVGTTIGTTSGSYTMIIILIIAVLMVGLVMILLLGDDEKEGGDDRMNDWLNSSDEKVRIF